MRLKNLRSIFGLDEFSDSVELNIGGTLINRADFAIPEKLFNWIVFGETNTAHPLDTFRCGQSCYFYK